MGEINSIFYYKNVTILKHFIYFKIDRKEYRYSIYIRGCDEIMFPLIKVIVSQFKLLEDNFEIDLTSKAKVYQTDKTSEIQERMERDSRKLYKKTNTKQYMN